MRLTRFAVAACLFALPAALAFAGPTLDGVDLGDPASGPPVKAADLKGRVVVFEYWGQHCPPCLASIPHLAALQAKYPYRSLVVVANQCQGGDAANAAKVWADHQGGPKVAVVNGGNLPGANVTGIPRVFVFDAFGKCVFDGRPGDGKFDAAIEAAVRSAPSAAALAQLENAKIQAKAMFGDAVPEELLPAAARIADFSQSSEGGVKMLEKCARAKDPKLSGQAKAMLEAFRKTLAERFAAAQALVADEPAQAWAGLQAVVQWAPQSAEAGQARSIMDAWMKDTEKARELNADKLWLGLKAQAAKVDFEKHPEARPTNQMENDFKHLVQGFPKSRALAKARKAAPGWKLDPETGRANALKPSVASASANPAK